jgi:lysophospholipase L1-like esterase
MGKAKTILIQVLVGIIFLEIVLRCLYFQRLGNDAFAIISAFRSVAFRASDNYRDRLLKNHNLIRPGSTARNEEIVDEVIESNSFEYAPWADFKLKDFHGKYVNSTGFLRKSVPDRHINAGADTLHVFLFGGSTMFGFDVTDNETIASYLAQLYSEQCSNCQSVVVHNYGVLSYYSYNELMLLHHLLTTGSKPDVVVFLNGLNDFFMMQAARKRVPWYYFRLKENIQNEKDSTLSLFQLYPGQTTESAANDVIRNYFQNLESVRKLCNAYSITPFFFVQPNPYYKYAARANDVLADTSRNLLIEYAYPAIEKQCDTSTDVIFLGNMLEHETGKPFIDEIHYSPEMNKKIAAEIFKTLQPISVSGSRK